MKMARPGVMQEEVVDVVDALSDLLDLVPEERHAGVVLEQVLHLQLVHPVGIRREEDVRRGTLLDLLREGR